MAIEVLLLGSLLLCDMFSSTMLKMYHNSGWRDHWKFLGALLAYNIVPVILLLCLKYDGIGNTNFYWNILSTVFVFIIAFYYFGEKITNTQFIGVILALFGTFLVINKKEL